MMFPKDLPERNPAHLAWIRTRPCSVCGASPPSEPSHHGKHGIGTKPSDAGVLPMCHGCHSHWHQKGTLMLFTGSREKLDEWLAATAASYYARSPARRVNNG